MEFARICTISVRHAAASLMQSMHSWGILPICPSLIISDSDYVDVDIQLDRVNYLMHPLRDGTF
ncbi:hypothetical protein PENTCL1PPCAC_6213, partial [Pristionchus entomophagus]